MIRNAKLSDLNEINKLGETLHNNFAKLFHLETEINSEFGIVLVSENNGVIDGYLYALEMIDNIDLISIVVDIEKRGRKIGSSLLEKLINHADAQNETITLEVAVDNLAAVELYKKYKFVNVNIRKGYYNGVDAILMRRK